jgi:hypothetical protein
MWLSTFVFDSAADSIQPFLLLAIAVASGAEAIYSAGARRAFWGGFLAAFVILNSRVSGNFLPRFNWLSQISISIARNFAKGPDMKHLMEHIQETLHVLICLIMSAAIGWLCVHIYRGHNAKPE